MKAQPGSQEANMKKQYSRREIMGIGLGAAAGTALFKSGEHLFSSSSAKQPSTTQSHGLWATPWKYTPLDVSAIKDRAYNSYFKGGCMFGVYEAITGKTAEILGKPYSDFPFEIATYGAGGVALWGTLCGTCNGAAMTVGMFHSGKVRNQLINEIFTWYENTALPLFVPQTPKKVEKDFEMKSSKAQSTLCHVSITRWCERSGYEPFAPQRVERCARLVADIAGFTTELLNKAALNEYKPVHQMSAAAAGCLSCHARGKQAPNEPEVVSKMSCTTCHPDAHHQDK